MMLKSLLVCFAVLVAITAALYGQTGVGQIQGTVHDPTGSVIPGATIGLEHIQTGNKFQTTTSGVGSFVFPSLLIGEYKLSATAAGMQKWEGQVLLQLGQVAAVNP